MVVLELADDQLRYESNLGILLNFECPLSSSRHPCADGAVATPFVNNYQVAGPLRCSDFLGKGASRMDEKRPSTFRRGVRHPWRRWSAHSGMYGRRKRELNERHQHRGLTCIGVIDTFAEFCAKKAFFPSRFDAVGQGHNGDAEQRE